LAIVDGHHCRLVSRRGHVFKQWPYLERELAHTVQAQHAVLDGEVVCLRPDGSSDFKALMFRRAWPCFYAFDLLELDGRDVRGEPLRARKRQLITSEEDKREALRKTQAHVNALAALPTKVAAGDFGGGGKGSE
jgi:bifunctional non-homologous end joining protein LigD